ncbi:hypothetical protein LOK49_LG14G00179 [Camellia lanceoleosa]|uniref:Uncharacterized protein n=1 Tax=Camellia lanceoleosa TaxID=1840588 RepID=A0ACC0FFJ7_9ERIC|nr:hypothetical protein LOK49_LG14G00179 [Camellia lanceoleosa]
MGSRSPLFYKIWKLRGWVAEERRIAMEELWKEIVAELTGDRRETGKEIAPEEWGGDRGGKGTEEDIPHHRHSHHLRP